MTDHRPGTFTCAWCKGEFDVPSVKGPPPTYCCKAHRQRAHEVRLQERRIAKRTATLAAALAPNTQGEGK